MFGLSKIQLGVIAGLLLTLVGAAWLAARQTEKLGEAKAQTAWLASEVESQAAQTTAALAEIAHRDAVLSGVEAERDALAKRKARVVTQIQEVLVNDPNAAECGNARVPDSVVSLVRQYASGENDGRAASEAARKPHDDRA